MAGTIEEIIRPIIEGTNDKELMISQLVEVFEEHEPPNLDYFLVFNPGMQLRKVLASDVQNLPNTRWIVVPKSNRQFYSGTGKLFESYRHIKTWRP